MRIAVDHDRCIGSGNCALAAGGVFDNDEDGIVVVRVERPPPPVREAVRDAVRACPSTAIWIESE